MNCSVCRSINAPGATVCVSCGSPCAATAPSHTPPSHTLKAGTKLYGGSYTVGKLLGQGGFGITYRGGDVKLKRQVAIKELFQADSTRLGTTVQPSPDTTAEHYAKTRRDFMQEAQTLAQFNHPGIVRVFDVFEENNTAYMVMEHLSGQTLQGRLDEQGALPEYEALRIIRRVGEALTAIHSDRVLHRDIKPDNIFLTDSKRVVLIDFGTARAFASNKTVRQTAMLTPGYAPLEQYGQQAKFGPYTDVYALAATLYHCLTGQMPVLAMDRLNGVRLRTPRQLNPKISSTVSQAVMAGLKLKAPERPQTIREFLDLLKKPKQPRKTPQQPRKTPPITPPPSNYPSPSPSNYPSPSPSTAPPVAPVNTAPRLSSSGWWHLIWIIALAWLGYTLVLSNSSQSVKKEFTSYYNKDLRTAFPYAYKALTALEQAQDTERYSVDATLRQTCIPQQQKFIAELRGLQPSTSEVRGLHKQLLDVAEQQLGAYESLLAASSRSSVDAAYDEVRSANDALDAWFRARDNLAAKYNLEITKN